MSTIAENISHVRAEISRAQAKHQITAPVELLAVSKTKPVCDLEAAYAAGQRHFGENYLQESLEKIEQLQDLDICWHFIGPIQSNKTRPLAENFAWVHSVDRLKIAKRLSEQRPCELPPLNICLQVNISGEQSKSGLQLNELEAVSAEIIALPNIRLRGLMAIPAPAQDFAEQQRPFAQLKGALLALQAAHPEQTLDTLSMGMSGDLEAAISQGANFVRIGTAIFGARSYP